MTTFFSRNLWYIQWKNNFRGVFHVMWEVQTVKQLGYLNFQPGFQAINKLNQQYFLQTSQLDWRSNLLASMTTIFLNLCNKYWKKRPIIRIISAPVT